MSNLADNLKALTFGVELDDDEMVTEAIILARVTRMSDGRSSFVLCGNEGLDQVVRAGLISCAAQVDAGGWVDVDDDDL